MRLSATTSLISRPDVIVVASVSCIYNLGTPDEYKEMCVSIEKGKNKSRQALIMELVNIHYERNDIDFSRGKFRVKGDTVEIFPAYLETAGMANYFLASPSSANLSWRCAAPHARYFYLQRSATTPARGLGIGSDRGDRSLGKGARSTICPAPRRSSPLALVR